MRKGARYWLAGFAAAHTMDALLTTARVRVASERPDLQLRKSGQPVIYTLWHGRLLPLAYLHRDEGVTTIISRSADGEYLARVIERWGYATARGSSSRGGSTALRELVKAVRAGSSLAITPDGPRGPRQKLKRGVLTAAQLTGAPLIPVSTGATAAWWFEGWDRFLIPKPFSTITVRYADPVFVPRDATEEDLAELEVHVERVLNELTDRVDADARRN